MMAFLSALKMLSRNVWIINYRVSKNNLRDSSLCLALNTIHQIKNAHGKRRIKRLWTNCSKNYATNFLIPQYHITTRKNVLALAYLTKFSYLCSIEIKIV